MNEELNKTYVALAGVSVSLGSSGSTDGELLFPNQDLAVPYTMGKATFFPTSYTHPHEVKPLKSERYVLLGWLYYECESVQEGASHLAPGSVFVRYPYSKE